MNQESNWQWIASCHRQNPTRRRGQAACAAARPPASSFVLAWLFVVLHLAGPGLAQETNRSLPRTADLEAKAGCEINLTKIFDALQQYQEKHGRLPNWLSDLVPEFIHNRDVLICPYVLKTGRLSEWRKGLSPEPGKDPLTYYHYEFCLEKAKWVSSAVSGRTYREYKQAQMQLLGEAVPIVRCLAHAPVLNLAHNGFIFENIDRDYWEESFAHLYPHLLLEPVPTFKAILPGPAPRHQARSPDASAGLFRPLNLSRHFNFLFRETSEAYQWTNHLSALPLGLHEWDGVPFDIRGLIHLTRASHNLPYPAAIDDIVVTQSCSTVHLLHGFVAQESPQSQGEFARVTLHREGVRDEIIRLHLPGEISKPGSDGVGTRTDMLVWKTTVTNITATTLPPRTLRLYHTSFHSAHPGIRIRSLGFSSTMTEAAPFLLAVTLE